MRLPVAKTTIKSLLVTFCRPVKGMDSMPLFLSCIIAPNSKDLLMKRKVVVKNNKTQANLPESPKEKKEVIFLF